MKMRGVFLFFFSFFCFAELGVIRKTMGFNAGVYITIWWAMKTQPPFLSLVVCG